VTTGEIHQITQLGFFSTQLYFLQQLNSGTVILGGGIGINSNIAEFRF